MSTCNRSMSAPPSYVWKTALNPSHESSMTRMCGSTPSCCAVSLQLYSSMSLNPSRDNSPARRFVSVSSLPISRSIFCVSLRIATTPTFGSAMSGESAPLPASMQ